MTNQVKTEPCLQGLTPACFRDHPEYAKRVFAYRLLQLLLPFEALKRLQKIPYAVWRRPLPDVKGISITPGLSSAWTSIAQPVYLPPWTPGPIKTTYSREGDIIVAVIHKAIINVATADDHTIATPASGKKIQLRSYALTTGGDVGITWLSGGNAISGVMAFGGENEPRGIVHNLGDYPLETEVDEVLALRVSDGEEVDGYITYTEA